MPLNNQGEAHANPSQPDYWHPFYRELEPTLEYLKDMWVGRRRWIDDDGTIADSEKAYYYLPQAEAQEDDQYIKQLRASVFIRFFRAAIEKDFSGLLVDYQLEDGKDIENYIDNIDLAGNSLQVFLKTAAAYALRDGSSFILVDMPKADPEAKSLADIKESEKRPYLVLFERDQVVNWRHTMTEGGLVLSMVVLKQTVFKPDGDFGLKEFDVYRVLHADGKYEVYESEKSDAGDRLNPQSDDAGDNLKKVDSGQFEAKGIPLVGLSLTCSDPFTADPPLLDFADLNLDHFRVRSGYRVTLDYMEPTLLAKEIQQFAMDENGTNKKISVGANSTVWNLEDLRWIEPAGGGIGPKERCLAMLEQQMEKMTVSFFTGGAIAKTATEVELDAAQAESALGGYAHHLESAVETIFRYWADYMGKDPDKAPYIVVNKALLKPPTAWTVRDISEMMATGQMTLELGYRIMQELQLLPEGIDQKDIDTELQKISGMQEEAQARAAEMEQRKMEGRQAEIQAKMQMQQQKLDAEAQKQQVELQREQMRSQREAVKAQGGTK
jgi:hypothetical protein